MIGRFARQDCASHWALFSIGLLLSAVVAAATAGYGVLVKAGFDGLDARDWGTIQLLAGLIVAATVIKALALYLQTLATNTGVQRALVGLQARLLTGLIHSDSAHVQAEASGSLAARFINDMNLVREAGLRVANNLAKSVLTIFGCVGVMLWLDWALALVLLVAYPIAFWPVIRLGERLRKTSKRAQEQTGEVAAHLTETFQGTRTVKAYGLENRVSTQGLARFQERAKLYLKVLRNRAAVDPILEVVGGLAFAGVLAFAGWRILSGSATTGDLVGFITMIAAMAPEVRALGTLQSVVAEAAAALERTYAEIDRPPSLTDATDAKSLPHPQGALRFEGVRFGYRADTPVLDGLSFDIAPGSFTALVGESGSGKSSVLSLLLRLYDPNEGVVSLDGHDLKALRLADVRNAFALVSQDAMLFDESLASNIGLGNPQAGRGAIEAAADAAAVTGFAAGFANGLDTPVGEAGRSLSGGQRQRVALARALLRDAPVLLLDEATSALDSVTEAKVLTTLEQLHGKRTIVVVAHRLATIRAADQILVMQAGRVVERGRHEELLAVNGVYARLVAHQVSDTPESEK